jgi:hypothetical protein
MDIHSVYRLVFKIWRAKRFSLFLSRMRPRSTDLLLDVGGNPGFWSGQPRFVRRIDTVNVDAPPVPESGFPDHDIRVLEGDGCALDFPAQSYDIGFSNSVIEHVGDWERQRQFASEIRRVAKALWVQTPAYACPIEPHYLTPFIHYLPRSFQKRWLRWITVWGWVHRPSQGEIDGMVDSTRLLRKAEMRQLFPDCDILTERLFGILPKSYIAVRRFPGPKV